MKTLYIQKLLFILFAFILYSCSTPKFVLGKYNNNINPFGHSSYEITFKDDSTCYFVNSRHMQEVIGLNGKYSVINNKLYIYLTEPTESEITRFINNDAFSTWSIKDEYNRYKLKEEKGIKYHFKYKIINSKLYVYRNDNGKLIKKALHYSEDKGRHYVKYYLEKVNE